MTGIMLNQQLADTWTNFNDINTIYEQNNKYDGIGFVLSKMMIMLYLILTMLLMKMVKLNQI